MTEKDKLNLVFLPGFSTAKSVTDVSGRGVGMDVVKTNIERFGGHIEIDSVPGAGVTIGIRIPTDAGHHTIAHSRSGEPALRHTPGQCPGTGVHPGKGYRIEG